MMDRRTTMATTKQPQCPNCGSRRTAIIIWGYPSREGEAMVQRGEAVYGGCFLPPPGQPMHTHACKACHHGFTFTIQRSS
jgi:hypothetical protein